MAGPINYFQGILEAVVLVSGLSALPVLPVTGPLIFLSPLLDLSCLFDSPASVYLSSFSECAASFLLAGKLAPCASVMAVFRLKAHCVQVRLIQ